VTMGHLIIFCPIARRLWSLVFLLFAFIWVMCRLAVDFVGEKCHECLIALSF